MKVLIEGLSKLGYVPNYVNPKNDEQLNLELDKARDFLWDNYGVSIKLNSLASNLYAFTIYTIPNELDSTVVSVSYSKLLDCKYYSVNIGFILAIIQKEFREWLFNEYDNLVDRINDRVELLQKLSDLTSYSLGKHRDIELYYLSKENIKMEEHIKRYAFADSYFMVITEFNKKVESL